METADGFTHWANQVNYTFCGEEITLVQDPSSHVLGSTVWDSAKGFMKYMEKNLHLFNVDTMLQKRKKSSAITVCELGAGLGLAGIALAKRGFHVVLTDVAPVIPWLEENIQNNFNETERTGKIQVMEYGWGTSPARFLDIFPNAPPFDIILCADVVYEAACVRPLVKSILALSNRKTVIYIANERRTSIVHSEFMQYLEQYFVWKFVPKEDMDEHYYKESLEVYECRRKHTKTPLDMLILSGDDAPPQDGLLHSESATD